MNAIIMVAWLFRLALRFFALHFRWQRPVRSRDVTQYHVRGKIMAVDTASGSVTVAERAIPGYMDAMTMTYKLTEPETISELHTGDVITAVLDVPENGEARMGQVVIVAQARPDNLPKVQYHIPQPGDAVPDFHLLDQSGKTLHLAQFRGKVVLLTFIYTRCPMASFCPKMSSNFAEIDKGLEADKAAYANTDLLSVSFDPKYDTPAVLRSYGGAHTGRFTQEQFRHWQFAAPSIAELPAMEQYFDVGVSGNTSDPASIMHSLSTVVIGRDGRVLAWYPSNDWKTSDVLQQMEHAAAS
jgi:protein SCO1/2